MESRISIFYHHENCQPQHITANIILTKEEETIFSLIHQVLKENNRTDVICRVSGRWVRNKLLSTNSSNIDIALENMEGSKIPLMILKGLSQGIETEVRCRPYFLIDTNSKTTVGMQIKNVWIRFTQLGYDTPGQFCTPEEDALRRDTTIHSLFYNLNTNAIEDLTHKGIDDLQNGIIRTPIDPYVAYKNDHSRIPRTARFVAKYHFNICDEILQCLIQHNDEFRNILRNSTCRIRIQQELNRIFKRNNAHRALYFLYQMNLLDSCLKLPFHCIELENNPGLLHKEITYSINVLFIGQYVYDSIQEFFDDSSDCIFNQINRKDLNLSLFTANFSKYISMHENSPLSLSLAIMKYRLLALDHDHDAFYSQRLTTCLDIYEEQINNRVYNRKTLGMLMYKINFANLGVLIIYSISADYLRAMHYDNSTEAIHSINEEVLMPLVLKYKNLIQYAKEEKLLHIDKIKTVLHPKEIMKELNIWEGREVGELYYRLIAKQITTPELTRDTALDYLKKKRLKLHNLEYIHFLD